MKFLFITSSILTNLYVIYIYIGSTENDKRLRNNIQTMINKDRTPEHCKYYIEKPRYWLVLYCFLKMKITAHILNIQFQCSKNFSYQG